MKYVVGDIVTRHSYQNDMLFRILELTDQTAMLAGEEMRLLADAPLDDLLPVSDIDKRKRRELGKQKEDVSYRLFRQDAKLMKKRNEYAATSGYESDASFFELRGRVLHLDGDAFYLQRCTELYERFGVPVYGVHLDEKKMPDQIASLLEMVQPDIVVITGHDAYLETRGNRDDLRAYRHTKYFAECVRIARKYCANRDQLIIFAGACQSHFETLIKAGANFASSPDRVNIHALDPVYIASKVSQTSYLDAIKLWEVLRNTITGEKGLGGIETKGIMRLGMPLKTPES
ncbi:sporulation peptidase YabG [Alkalicoccobacillus gibsonii]|jgi:spore coat assemly protein|uniref:sporulation peptidase YabG n=1 Tax=Alkalicoccobacillus gibsonii TaxID=79881 RepID=UPI0019334D75|nr:sporulation peptidase YabG [Alkalicoccobacillus gibsonii]MBM0067802.1 sporulation peptidase YabG [Alkalicoccobacillus gibsonii]